MKNTISLLLFCVFSLSSIPALSNDLDTATPARMKTYACFGLSIGNSETLNNFKVGNANQFYQWMLQDNTLELDDGSQGFLYFGIGMSSAMQKHGMLGLEFNYFKFNSSKAIYGSDISTQSTLKGKMEFGLKVIDIGFRYGYMFGPKGGNMSLEFGMPIGFMNGNIERYGAGAFSAKEKSAFATGFRLGVGFDVPVSNFMLIFARMGYRSMIIPEKHEDSQGKLKSYYANGSSGETVKVDFSGLYFSLGMGIVLNKKK